MLAFHRILRVSPLPQPSSGLAAPQLGVPHIYFKVTSRDFGELTSQIFIGGEVGNDRDFVLRSMRSEAERSA